MGTFMRFTPSLLRQMIDLHRLAEAQGWQSFPFQGGELDTRYAGYLIEYLVPKLLPERARGGGR